MYRLSRTAIALAAFAFGVLVASGEASAQGSDAVHVVVDNQGYYDMHVYVLDGSTRRSLGLVTGLARREFTLPQIVVDSHRDVRIFANPIAGRNDYLSQSLLVGPGDWITVVLRGNPNLSYSSVSDYAPGPGPGEAQEDSSTDPDDSPDSDDSPDPDDSIDAG